MQSNNLQTCVLGKTGITITKLGAGGHFTVGPTAHENIPRRVKEIHSLIDAGITYFDVQWEEEADAMARVLKERRTAITVAWPLHGMFDLKDKVTSKYIIDYTHEYCRKYGIEHMDILLWIALELQPESSGKVISEVNNAVLALKKKGLISHFGFSCHHSPDMAIRGIEAYDGFSVIMVPFGPLLPAAAATLLPLTRSRNIGTVAMKPFGGWKGFFNKVRIVEGPVSGLEQWKGSSRPFFAALRWVLACKDLDCAAPGVCTDDEIKGLVAEAHAPFSQEDKAILEEFKMANAREQYSQELIKEWMK